MNTMNVYKIASKQKHNTIFVKVRLSIGIYDQTCSYRGGGVQGNVQISTQDN